MLGAISSLTRRRTRHWLSATRRTDSSQLAGRDSSA